MKQCPACRSQYTDDTLKFCLQDGTPLVSLGDVGYGETETVVSSRALPTNPVIPFESDVLAVPAKKQNTGLIVAVTVMSTLLLFGMIAAGYYISTRGGRQETSRVNVNAVPYIAANENVRPTPPTTPSPTPPLSNVNVNTSQTPDSGEISREVTKAIAGWKSETESLDLDSLAERYADSVDYYHNNRASREFVKDDKDRAFSRYDSINLEISNIKITANTSDTATAEFDKAWVFDGDGHSEGKVRSRLTLKKVAGKWLISGEQDIKVY